MHTKPTVWIPHVPKIAGNIDYSKLDTPELESINTEYKYYTDLGVTL